MRKIAALAGLLLVVTAACGKQPENADAPPAAAAPSVASVSAPGAQAPTPTTPADADAIAAGEALDNEGEDEDTPITTRANLQLASAVAPAETGPPSRWQEGTNYKILVPTQPTNVSPDKVEVVEVFWYGCPHCFSLEPHLKNWEQKKAAYIQFARIPVVWGPVHRAQARLFYALAALNKGPALHEAAFAEIQRGNALVSSDPAETERMQAAFAKRNGVTEQEFRNAYASMGVQTRLSRAEDLTRRYRVDGVPLIVINGKYTADVASAGGQNELIALINDLAAREQKKQ